MKEKEGNNLVLVARQGLTRISRYLGNGRSQVTDVVVERPRKESRGKNTGGEKEGEKRENAWNLWQRS